MAIFLQNTNEFPLFWQGARRAIAPRTPSPMLRLVNGEGADGLKTLKSWRAGQVGSWEADEFGR